MHITDFGIAKYKSNNNKNETSGTPGYMAPEVMKGMNHTGSVDYFAVGVITYELMMGQRPYVGKNRKEIKEQMMSKQIYIDEEMIPFGWSEESADFINRLMVRKDTKRLGFYKEIDIKNHPWFFDIDFDELVEKKIEAPFSPKINHDNYDKKYCEEIEKIGYETNYRYEEYKANEHYEDIFYGFTFYNVDESNFDIYKKQNIKYTQSILNQKYKIIDNIKGKESKTINVDNYSKVNKYKQNIFVIRKERTIDIDYKMKNNDKDTIDVENNFNNNYNIVNENKSNKSINIAPIYSQNENCRKNLVVNIHERIKSNSIGHNFLYFLQKKKLSNLDNKTNSLKNISNNDISSINENKTKSKINHSSICHKNIFSKPEKIIHEHSNSFNNNLYVNLLNKLKENHLKEECYKKEPIIDNHRKKRRIELNQIPRLIKIYNNNYKNLKNIKNEINNFSSIEQNESISSIDNNINKKIDMMKASSNFYIRRKIIKNKLNKITPINLRNKNPLLNTNYNFNKNYDSIRNEETSTNSRRAHIKVRTRSFSGRPIFDDLQNIKKQISQGKDYYTKSPSSIKNKINKKKILLNSNKNSFKEGEIRHNYSYSSVNKYGMESLIKNLIEPEKHLKKLIPINYKKSSNTLFNMKVSTLHKKIPIPSSFGQKIFHKRMNGYFIKKLNNTTSSSFSISANNNSINNCSLPKKYIVNNNTSVNKSFGKVEYINNKSNRNINEENKSINACKKTNFKPTLNKNQNFTSILKKMNDFSKLKKKVSVENIIQISKENKLRKFVVKNNLFKNQIKKIGENKNQSQEKEDLKKKRKKEQQNENKKFYGNILNNNIIKNKKCINYNHKNKYIDNKIIKNSIRNFSYPSYNSTTSSGIMINNK